MLLGVLVTFHELGHYYIARASGVRVLRFSVGFGRAIWSRVDARGTEWAVAMIPFGGYVRMLDDRDPQQASLLQKDELAYMDLHPKWRIAIAVGGPLANFVLAILVFAILQVAGSYKTVPTTDVPAPESLVGLSGLSAPAELLSVDGEPTDDWQQVALALTKRLGETGEIEINLRPLDARVPQTIQVPILDWHQGVGDPDVIRSLGLSPSLQAWIGEVVPNTPASEAGLAEGDWVMAANGTDLGNWFDFVAVIEGNPNKDVLLEIVRDGIRLEKRVRPGTRATTNGEVGGEVGEDGGKGFLGVGPKNRFVQASWSESLPNAVVETWEKSALILQIMGKMVVGEVSVKNLSGPISIAQVAGDSAQYGWRQFFGILAFLSISLGVLNLLPIPILDGGHVVFSTVEWVMGRPVPEQVQVWGVQIGLALVGCMLVFATYNDVLRLF